MICVAKIKSHLMVVHFYLSFLFLNYSRLYTGLPWWLSDKEPACQCSRHGFDLWSGRSPRVGNGSPFQYFLENPRQGRGVWQAAWVHGPQKSCTGLSNWTTTYCIQKQEMTKFTDSCNLSFRSQSFNSFSIILPLKRILISLSSAAGCGLISWHMFLFYSFVVCRICDTSLLVFISSLRCFCIFLCFFSLTWLTGQRIGCQGTHELWQTWPLPSWSPVLNILFIESQNGFLRTFVVSIFKMLDPVCKMQLSWV